MNKTSFFLIFKLAMKLLLWLLLFCVTLIFIAVEYHLLNDFFSELFDMIINNSFFLFNERPSDVYVRGASNDNPWNIKLNLVDQVEDKNSRYDTRTKRDDYLAWCYEKINDKIKIRRHLIDGQPEYVDDRTHVVYLGDIYEKNKAIEMFKKRHPNWRDYVPQDWFFKAMKEEQDRLRDLNDHFGTNPDNIVCPYMYSSYNVVNLKNIQDNVPYDKYNKKFPLKIVSNEGGPRYTPVYPEHKEKDHAKLAILKETFIENTKMVADKRTDFINKTATSWFLFNTNQNRLREHFVLYSAITIVTLVSIFFFLGWLFIPRLYRYTAPEHHLIWYSVGFGYELNSYLCQESGETEIYVIAKRCLVLIDQIRDQKYASSQTSTFNELNDLLQAYIQHCYSKKDFDRAKVATKYAMLLNRYILKDELERKNNK